MVQSYLSLRWVAGRTCECQGGKERVGRWGSCQDHTEWEAPV